MIVRLFSVLLICLASLLDVPAVAAQQMTARGYADQAVLVHRMTKSVCMLFVGAQTPVHAQDALQSAEQLELRAAALEEGNTHVSRGTLATYAASARQIVAGDRHSVPVSQMLRKNPELAAQYRHAWRSAAVNVTPAYQNNFRLVQELRVQSQAFQRDLCLFLTGLAGDTTASILKTDIAFFAQTLDVLIAGNPDQAVEPAPNIYIKVALGKVQSKWTTLEPILSQAAADGQVDVRDAQLASVLGDAILENLDEVSDRFMGI